MPIQTATFAPFSPSPLPAPSLGKHLLGPQTCGCTPTIGRAEGLQVQTSISAMQGARPGHGAPDWESPGVQGINKRASHAPLRSLLPTSRAATVPPPPAAPSAAAPAPVLTGGAGGPAAAAAGTRETLQPLLPQAPHDPQHGCMLRQLSGRDWSFRLFKCPAEVPEAFPQPAFDERQGSGDPEAWTAVCVAGVRLVHVCLCVENWDGAGRGRTVRVWRCERGGGGCAPWSHGGREPRLMCNAVAQGRAGDPTPPSPCPVEPLAIVPHTRCTMPPPPGRHGDLI